MGDHRKGGQAGAGGGFGGRGYRGGHSGKGGSHGGSKDGCAIVAIGIGLSALAASYGVIEFVHQML